MILTKEGYQQYLYKTYSSWLGKIIGIRLGAPVENMSSQQISEKYPNMSDYPVNYGIFAADDDSNGPLFLARHLLDNDAISAEDIANTYLNYVQEYSGFFWWGGVGVSTEHTAYENLKNGLKPPLSGSVATNGQAIAEQIGGQIFSDVWGYIAGYDPLTAKQLAIMQSSISHDRNGIQGAIFVAVAITLAYSYDDIHKVVNDALEYLDKSLEYYQVAHDIIDFYHHNNDQQACLKYIQETYGYDKYPGVCHIIPNMCLMIMALEYGDGNFDKTMIMLNKAGWDTDCNCGNVGSILGALVGVDNIDKKWIIPNNDIVNASSCVGSLNIQTISQSAKMFAKIAYKLKGIEIVDNNKFDLPYATSGFICDKECKYKYNYYLGKDIYDARYDPEFSPIVYPNDELIITCQNQDNATIFVQDCDGQIYEGEKGSSHFVVPKATNLVINKIGIKNAGDIIDYQIIHHSQIDIEFKNLPLDTYGPRWGGDYKNNLRSFVVHHGQSELTSDGLKVENEYLATSGCLEDKYNNISLELSGNAYIVFNCKGYMYFDGIGIENHDLIWIHKDISTSKTIIGKVYKEVKKIEIRDENIYLDDEYFAQIPTKVYGYLYGIMNDTKNPVLFKKLYIK